MISAVTVEPELYTDSLNQTVEDSIREFSSRRYCSGIIGVPITFLDKYNPDQFEIIGMDLNDSVESLGIGEIGDTWVQLYRKQGGKFVRR